ncbi:MAG: hypothetical protein IPJ13_04875 [Saprospiraceae bacterium]|nr:hypothetical protein [Saprospiraceae bacterium]
MEVFIILLKVTISIWQENRPKVEKLHATRYQNPLTFMVCLLNPKGRTQVGTK